MYDDIPLDIQDKKESLQPIKWPLVTCVCLTVTPKRFHLLPDALRSYRQQTYSPRELLVINDGKPLVSRAPDVRVINLPDRGKRWSIGEKRNVGIREAHGEFLAVWDDDDVSLPRRLAEQVAAALSWNADYVMADSGYVSDMDLNLTGDCEKGPIRVVLASSLIRRSLLVAAGGYRPVNYLEDVEMLERIRYLARGSVATMPGAKFYVMRRHQANATLVAGENHNSYFACAAHNPDARAAAAGIDTLRLGPGATDVVETTQLPMAS